MDLGERAPLPVIIDCGRGELECLALGRWGQLRRFLDYGRLELSDNLAENAIRPVAVGRKNWLHVGSERAGPRVAAAKNYQRGSRNP